MLKLILEILFVKQKLKEVTRRDENCHPVGRIRQLGKEADTPLFSQSPSDESHLGGGGRSLHFAATAEHLHHVGMTHSIGA